MFNCTYQRAVTEMVPNLIWAPDYFDLQEIWAPRSLVPHEKAM